jgi:hypothetical protein
MAYREVTMLEVKEVLRLWLAGIPTDSPSTRAERSCIAPRSALQPSHGRRPRPGSTQLVT